MASRHRMPKRFLPCHTSSNDIVHEQKTTERRWEDLDEGPDTSHSNTRRNSEKMSRLREKGSRMGNQDQASKRRLLPSDSSGGSSVEKCKTEKWWNNLSDSPYQSPSNDPHSCNSLSPRNSDSNHLMRESKSFMTSGSGFSCSDFSVESKEMSRMIQLKKSKKVFGSPVQYNMEISNENTFAFEGTLHRTSDPNVSSFKIETSLDDFSRSDNVENINPLFNRVPKRKIEHEINYSRVLPDMTHLVSHTSVMDTVYEHVDKSKSGVIDEVNCDIYESEKYEAPATATYCRQTVERNGARMTYVTISEVKERVNVQNRSCRVPRKNCDSRLEFSEAVTELSYDSDCMVVQHINSPTRPSYRHINSGRKKEKKSQDTDGPEILIETLNPMDSSSESEVEDISDLLNRSGPIEKIKYKHGKRTGESKHLLAICDSEYKEILDEQPLVCENTSHSPPGRNSHYNQTSSFSMSESFERSGKKKSGRKKRKQSQIADIPKELSERTFDRSDSGSFIENIEHGIPDYPYFANKRKRGQMKQKMSINSGIFADAFDSESVSVSHCQSGKNNSKNSDSSYSNEANANNRSRKSLYHKMAAHNADQALESDPVKMRDKCSSHGHNSFKSDSIEIQDVEGCPVFQKKERKTIPPISSNAFSDALNSDSVLDHTGSHNSGDLEVQHGRNSFLGKSLCFQNNGVKASLDVSANHKRLSTSPANKLLRNRRGKNDGEFQSTSFENFDEMQESPIIRRRAGNKSTLSINSSEFDGAFNSEGKSNESSSLSASDGRYADLCHQNVVTGKDTSFQGEGSTNVPIEDPVKSKMGSSGGCEVAQRKMNSESVTKDDSQFLNEVISLDSDKMYTLTSLQKRKGNKINLSIHSNEFVEALGCDKISEIPNSHLSVLVEDKRGSRKVEQLIEKGMKLRESGEKQVTRDESQSLDEISIVSDVDATNEGPFLRRKRKNKNAMHIDLNTSTDEVSGNDHTIDSKNGKSSSKSDPSVSTGETDGPVGETAQTKMMNVAIKNDSLAGGKIEKNRIESKSISEGGKINFCKNEANPIPCKVAVSDESLSIGENSSITNQNVPALQRNRERKAALPINSSVFDGILASDQESDSSSVSCLSEAMVGKGEDPPCKKVKTINDNVSMLDRMPEKNGLIESFMVNEVSTVSCDKTEAQLILKGNEEVGSEENAAKVVCLDSKSNKYLSSKSSTTDESLSIGDHSINKQNSVCQNDREKKSTPLIKSNVSAGILVTNTEVHYSSALCPEAVLGNTEDPTCVKEKTVNEKTTILDRKAEKKDLTEFWTVSKGSTVSKNPILKENEVEEGKRVAEFVGSDVKYLKLSSSKSAMNDESMLIGESSGMSSHNVPVFQRNKEKKTVLPTNSSVFAGVLGSDPESDCSSAICPSEVTVGSEGGPSCEEELVRNEENVAEVASEETISGKCPSKSSVNNDNLTVGANSSLNNHNAPVFHRNNREKKTTLPINSSVFAGVLGSDPESDCSKTTCPSEVMVRHIENEPCLKGNNNHKTITLLDGEARSNVLPESQVVSNSSSSVSCNGSKSNPVPRKEAEEKSTLLTKTIKSGFALGSERKAKRNDSLTVNGNDDGLPVGEKSCIENQNMPIFLRNRGKNAPLNINSSVFVGVLGTDLESDSSSAVSSSESEVVGKEDDSLLPDCEFTKLKPDGGYFESTRGFIATDTKSPFSRISKQFGDLSCILRESIAKNSMEEEEGGDAAIAGRENCTPSSLKVCMPTDNVEIAMDAASCDMVEPMVWLLNHSKKLEIPNCSLSHDSNLKMNFEDHACCDQLLKPDHMDIEFIPQPILSPVYNKEPDMSITNELIIKPPLKVDNDHNLDHNKYNDQNLENVDKVLAAIPSSISKSFEQKQIAGSAMVLLPDQPEEIHLPGQSSNDRTLRNGIEAIETVATSLIAPLKQKEGTPAKDEQLPQTSEVINLPKQASNVRNLRTGSAASEEVQPSPITLCSQKEGLPSTDEPLPKPLEVIHLPKQASTGRNVRSGSRTASGIPIPIASMGAKKRTVTSIGNVMPSHTKTMLKLPSSLTGTLPLEERKASISSESHIIADGKPVPSSGEVHVTSLKMDATTAVAKSLSTAKSSPSPSQDIALAHTSQVADDNVSMVIPVDEISSEIPAVNDMTFIKTATYIAHKGSCISSLTFIVEDHRSEPGILLSPPACEISNLTFSKSSSEFDAINQNLVHKESTSAVSTLGHDPLSKVAVPHEGMKSKTPLNQVIEAEPEASTQISQHKVGSSQAFPEKDLTPEGLMGKVELSAQTGISPPESVTSLVDHDLQIARVELVKSVGDREETTRTPASQSKIVGQLVSPASPASKSNAQSVPPKYEISSIVPGESFVPVEPDHHARISQQSQEIQKVGQEKLDDLISVYTLAEKGPALHTSEQVDGKHELIIDHEYLVNSVAGREPKDSVNLSQPEIKILKVSQVKEVDGLTSMVSIADSNLEISPLQYASETNQAVCLLGSNALSELEVKIVESERNESSFNTAPPECVATNMEKPAENIIPTDDFSPVVVTDHQLLQNEIKSNLNSLVKDYTGHQLSHGEIKSNLHSLANDSTGHQLSHGEIKSNSYSLVKDITGNKNLSTRTKIIEKSGSIDRNSAKNTELSKPRSSHTVNFKSFNETMESDLLMLSPLNIKLISTESSGPSTSSSAIYSGQVTETEFSGDTPEVLRTSKWNGSEKSLSTRDLTPSQDLLNSDPGYCAKQTVELLGGDRSAADIRVTAKDLSPSLNNQSGTVFNVQQLTEPNSEAPSGENAPSHREQQVAASSDKEALIESVNAKRFWITSHGEESGPVAMAFSGERSVSHQYERIVASRSASTPNSQVSGPIYDLGQSSGFSSVGKSMTSSREDSVPHTGEKLAAGSHKREKVIQSASAKPLGVSSHDGESKQSCSYQTTEESTASTVQGCKKGDNSKPSAMEGEIEKIVDNVLRKLDEACAQQRQQELEQARSTVQKFSSLFPTKFNPDKKKLKSCARGQPPKLRKRRDPTEQVVKKLRRLPAWCTKNLKKMLVEAMEELEMSYLDQEEFLFDFADIVKQVIKSKDVDEVQDGVINIQKRLFDLKIVRTLSDFFQFVRNYLPREFRCRSIPCTGWDDPIYASWVDDSDLNKPLF